MVVSFPSSFNRSSMYSLLQQVIDSDQSPLAGEISFDFSTLRFIEPVGVTILSNLTQMLLQKGVKVIYSYPNNPRSFSGGLKYLDDSQYFKRYLGNSLSPLAAIRSTTIPLEMVTYAESVRWLNNTADWLSQRLKVSSSSLTTVKSCIQELFNNIKDHSSQLIGCVFAQHYPNMNLIKFAISDFGVGIPFNIQQMLPSLNDGEAIFKATEQGFSTKSTPNNRGAGLDQLIYNVVKNNQGNVYIHSNRGILNCSYHNDFVQKSWAIAPSNYPGTLIEIIFRTDTIEGILDFEEEFEWF